MSDQKLFRYPTILNDVSVGNFRHSLVQSPRKSLIYIYIYIERERERESERGRDSLIFKFFQNLGCATFQSLCVCVCVWCVHTRIHYTC